MDKVPQQLSSVCSDLQEEILWAVDKIKLDLELRIMTRVDQQVALLEARMEAKYNESP